MPSTARTLLLVALAITLPLAGLVLARSLRRPACHPAKVVRVDMAG